MLLDNFCQGNDLNYGVCNIKERYFLLLRLGLDIDWARRNLSDGSKSFFVLTRVH
jgi:hypothetical protein